MRNFDPSANFTFESPFNDELMNTPTTKAPSGNFIPGLDQYNSPFQDIEFEFSEESLDSDQEAYEESELMTDETDFEDHDNEIDYEIDAESDHYESEVTTAFQKIPLATAPTGEDSLLPGTTLYLKIDLGKSNYPLDFTGVYIPAAFDAAKPVDVVLYLHGMTHAFPGSNAKMNIYWNAHNAQYDLRLREEVEASGRNVVFVAPSLGKSPNASSNLLSSISDGLDRYLNTVKQALHERVVQPRFPGRTVDFRAVILCAHSAGGQQMRMIATAKNPIYGPRIAECWGFDSLYGGMRKWLGFAEKNKDKKLYIYYLTSTQKNALYMKSKSSRLSNIVISRSTARNHYMVPKEHLLQRLQQMSVAQLESELYDTESSEDFEDSFSHVADEMLMEAEALPTDALERKMTIQNNIKREADIELRIWEKKKEHQPGMYDHVKRYWVKGMDYPETEADRMIQERIESIVQRKKEPAHPWSSAFISYIMRKATNKVFPRRGNHTAYAHWASRNTDPNIPFALFKIDAPEAVLEVGDILINARIKPLATFEEIIQKGERKSHGDIVIAVDPIRRKAKVFGGNKNRSVQYLEHDLTADGKILQKPLYIDKQKVSDYKFIAVVKLMPPLGVSSASSLPQQQPASQPSASGKWERAIQLNAYYADKLGWGKSIIEINDLILPYSGYSNVSLGPEAFAVAVSQWQRSHGFTEDNSDGVIGPMTWAKMLPLLSKPNNAFVPSAPTPTTVQPPVLSTGYSDFVKKWGNKEDAGKYIETLTYQELPGLSGKPFSSMTSSEKKQFQEKWNKNRRLILEQRKILIQSGYIPATGGEAVPFGFSATSYKSFKGLKSQLTSDRLDQVLSHLHRQGKISITQEQLDLFQRVANVETSGKIQTLNAYDGGVVSIGWMQFTIHVGKIQQWIKLAPASFKRYGIELDPRENYDFGDNGKHPAILGVSQRTIDQLRWNGWAERFYYAGLDPEIIAAEVTLCLQYLKKHLESLRNRLKDDGIYNLFYSNYYLKDPYVRGLFQASHNNNPARSTKCVRNTFDSIAGIFPTVENFISVYKQTLQRAGWERLTNETAVGTTVTLTMPADKEFEDENFAFEYLEDTELEANENEEVFAE